jgi:hypothetical protein
MSASALPKPRLRSLQCPNCGGTVELRGFQHTLSAVCLQCCSILDPTTPSVQVIQKFNEKARVKPLIPLGSRGQLQGVTYELIGFQVRAIVVEGVAYSWHEYLLFNPYHGFRYLSQYDGHWNDIVPVRGLPTYTSAKGRKAALFQGKTFAHFQNSHARTTFVMGEFPWQVKVGEQVEVDDFVDPPRMLSAEKTANEITWSIGEYTPGPDIWRAFNLPGSPPAARGAFANQPSPYTGKVGPIWRKALLLMVVWAVLLAWFTFAPGNKVAFQKSFLYDQSAPGEHSLVTDIFDLGGRDSNVEVDLRTDLNNDWAFFSMALINEQTGQGFDFGREVNYYSGRDSDGNWTEGSRRDSVTIPRVPAGRYYLRIEPEMDTSGRHSVRYDVTVRRDVPSVWLFWLALPLLIIPPIVYSIRAGAFEARRWRESDYAPSGGDD